MVVSVSKSMGTKWHLLILHGGAHICALFSLTEVIFFDVLTSWFVWKEADHLPEYFSSEVLYFNFF